jgi:hypothetical protein
MGTNLATRRAVRLIAKNYYGDDGLWLCQTFDAINRKLFGGALPQALITIEMTRWSCCLGWCWLREGRLPHIVIHPTVFGVAESRSKLPWGLSRRLMGRRFAFDVLLHECVHISIHHRLGGYEGPSSHNNEQWINEVNRLCPLIGLRGIEAGRQVPKRVLNNEKTGTVVKKVDEGNLPFSAVASFPHGIRIHQGSATRFYRRGRLPGGVQL